MRSLRIAHTPNLNESGTGGSNHGLVSSAVGPGDVYRVEAIFDLPNTGDKKCSTFLAW